MRHIPPLAAVRVFEAAARHENFTSAAAELGMTQAAVSYQIRLLEERLGVALFIRERRRVTLSEAGRRAAPIVSSAFDSLSDAFSAVRADDAQVLTISTAQTFAMTWLASRLGRFQMERPDLAVRMQTENAVIDFARAEADVAIRSGAGEWPGLAAHFLYRVHFTPMCSPDYRDRHPQLAQPAGLLEVARLSSDDHWWRDWFAAVGMAPPAARAPGIRLDSQASEGELAMAGHGVALLSPIYWPNDMARHRLVRLYDRMGFDGQAMWLVYPQGRRNQPKVRVFRDWLMAEIAVQAEGDRDGVFDPP